MKRTKFTEAQIAFILKQAEEGARWRRCAARRDLGGDVLRLAQEVCGSDAVGDEAAAATRGGERQAEADRR